MLFNNFGKQLELIGHSVPYFAAKNKTIHFIIPGLTFLLPQYQFAALPGVRKTPSHKMTSFYPKSQELFSVLQFTRDHKDHLVDVLHTNEVNKIALPDIVT